MNELSDRNDDSTEAPKIDDGNQSLSRLIQIANNKSFQPSEIIDLIKSISKRYSACIGTSAVDFSIEKIIQIFYPNFKNSPSEEKFLEVLEKIQQEKKYYYLDYFSQILTKNYLESDLLYSKFLEKGNETGNSDEMIKIVSEFEFSDGNASFNLYFNNQLHFYLQKVYANEVDQKAIEREKDMMNSKYSKFIVQISKVTTDSIFIPYFPLGTLGSFLYSPDQSNSPKIEITIVDKIIIMKEIAIAIRDLHSNNQFHGFLSHKAIYLNSKKDAFLGSLCFDPVKEAQLTKPSAGFYNQTPESAKKIIESKRDNTNKNDDQNEVNSNNSKDDYDDFSQNVKSDIYSFGVLVYSIFSNVSPEARMEKMTRADRLKILSGDYYQYLIDQNDIKIFDNDDLMQSIKELIKKCMKREFTSFDDILKTIDKLINDESVKDKSIKDEIEYRIENATQSSDYFCTLTDLVICFFRKQENSLNCIDKFFSEFTKLFNDYEITPFSYKGDMLGDIFEYFEAFVYIDYTDELEPFFNVFLKDMTDSLLDHNSVNDLTDMMLNYSIRKNTKSAPSVDSFKCINYIVPIYELENYMNDNNNNKIDLFFAYLIANDISKIHSRGFFHGDLSTRSIGIYFDQKTGKFIPSVILYYFFYKRKKIANISDGVGVKRISKIKKKKKSFSVSEIVEKNQKKDVKWFLNFLFENFNDKITKSDFQSSSSILEIVSTLYNYCTEANTNNNSIYFEFYSSKCDYSNFQVTFSSFKKFYPLIDNSKTIINFTSILYYINKFIEIAISEKESSISIIIEKVKSSVQINDSIRISLPMIIKNWYRLFISLFESDVYIGNDPIIIETEYGFKIENKRKNESIVDIDVNNITKSNFTFCDFLKTKVDLKNHKLKNFEDKEVYRYIEFTGLSMRSFEYLLRRYIHLLNKNFKYRITIKLRNKTHFETQDKSIKLEDIIRVVKSINPNWLTPKPEDGNIIVFVNQYNGK